MEACSSFFLPRLIGYSRATRLVTTGEALLATDKVFDGLFTEIVDGGAESVRQRARYYAEMIASETSIVASYLCRSMLWHGPSTVEEAHLRKFCSPLALGTTRSQRKYWRVWSGISRPWQRAAIERQRGRFQCLSTEETRELYGHLRGRPSFICALVDFGRYLETAQDRHPHIFQALRMSSLHSRDIGQLAQESEATYF